MLKNTLKRLAVFALLLFITFTIPTFIYSVKAEPVSWSGLNGAQASNSSDNLQIGIGQGNYVLSSSKFRLDNFELTLEPQNSLDGWWMIGFVKNYTSFNSAVTSQSSYNDAGVFLMIRNTTEAGYDYNVEVYVFEPGIGNMWVGARGNFNVKKDSNGLLKLRMYKDESGRYVQMNINGEILRNGRLRCEDVPYVFGTDELGYLLFQSWPNVASDKYSLLVSSVNNKSPYSSEVTSPDENNLPDYLKPSIPDAPQEPDEPNTERDPLAYGCAIVSKDNANSSNINANTVLTFALLMGSVGVFTLIRFIFARRHKNEKNN